MLCAYLCRARFRPEEPLADAEAEEGALPFSMKDLALPEHIGDHADLRVEG